MCTERLATTDVRCKRSMRSKSHIHKMPIPPIVYMAGCVVASVIVVIHFFAYASNFPG